jgi:hypothetical protein
MSLNSIKFEPTDIAFLFKNSLVEINAEQQLLPQTKIETESDQLPGGNILEKIKRKPWL